MTINQLRCKLGKILKPVFTEDFSRKYSMIAAQDTPGSIDRILFGYKDDIDAYIHLAEHLSSSNDMLRFLAMSANPLVVYGVFIRYHFLTQLFISMDQSSMCSFVSDESTILTDVLIGKWEDVLRQYQCKSVEGFRLP